MKILIKDTRKISSIQEEFNKKFPFLKLEFFSRPHKRGAGSPRRLMKADTKTLGECRKVHKQGSITITPKMTVAELEERFAEVYGLFAQVFRKSGKLWLESTFTDNWTLEEQNAQGESLSKAPEEIAEVD